jgi:hypothetical protein
MARAALQDGIVRRATLLDPMVALRYECPDSELPAKPGFLELLCETFCAGLRSYT